MARPKKELSDKAIKKSISLKPDVSDLLDKYSFELDLSASWIIDKALRDWFEEQNKKQNKGEG